MRWAGHVDGMPTTRLPLNMLSSWVRTKRPSGAPRLTYGRTLNKAPRKANFDTNTWHVLAKDKLEWRRLIR